MMRILKQRVLVTLISTALATASGAGIGYLMGIAISIHMTEGKLQQYATHLLDVYEDSSREARIVLDALSAAPFAHCSDEKLGYFRDLMFQAQYLRDVGSIRKDKIECSANMGRLAQPLPLPKPDFSQHDGIQLYRDLTPPQLRNLTRIGLRKGDAFVIFGDHSLGEETLSQLHYLTTESDLSAGQTGWLAGGLPHVQGMIVTRNAEALLGSTLYSTRCSIPYSECVTAYSLIPEVLRANRPEIVGFIVLGGLFGVFFGLFFSILYQRSQSMERQLHRAIRKDKLRLVYQPIVNLVSERIVGAEALVRWNDDQGVAVGPDVFVKIAEEAGFVGEITSLVVRHALRDFAGMLDKWPEFHLNINVTAADLSDSGFLSMMERALQQAEVPAQSLVVEITESSTARHELAMETIRQLRQRGFSVHIDDFGTGYSSLSYLHALSVDAIKIDKTFTQAIGTESVTVSIIPQILAMAAGLKLAVTVEGIETAEQADYFAAYDQPILAQGWLFGRPVPIEQFRGLVVKESLRRALPATAA
jgi:sensor c-di-GMP phosphodiesterase-like protein